MYQHPIVGVHRPADRDQAIEHRVAPRLAATIKRVQLSGERFPIVAREVLVMRREYNEDGRDLRHAKCTNRVPQHGLARERQVLLGCAGRDASAATRGRNQGEGGQSSSNSGRYNCTLCLLMQRDPLPARRRYTRLAGSADALALARLAQEEHPIAVVSATAFDAQRLRDEIAWFSPQLRVCLLPDWETLPYDQFSPHHDLVSERLATLYRIQRGESDVAIVPASTALVRMCPPAYIAARTFFLRSGSELDLDQLKAQLATAGYQHVTQVVAPGEVCVRGGLIDLFPMGSALPYRLDLDDELIDSIKTFDVDTQRTLYSVNEIRMLPAREFPLDDAGRARFRSRWREIFEGDPSKKRLYRDVSNGVPAAGIEYYLPLFFESTATLFDYLPKGSTLALHHDVSSAITDFWRDIKSRYSMQGGDPDRPLLAPAEMFVPAEEFYLRAKEHPRLDVQELDEPGDGPLAASALPPIAVDRRAH